MLALRLWAWLLVLASPFYRSLIPFPRIPTIGGWEPTYTYLLPGEEKPARLIYQTKPTTAYRVMYRKRSTRRHSSTQVGVPTAEPPTPVYKARDALPTRYDANVLSDNEGDKGSTVAMGEGLQAVLEDDRSGSASEEECGEDWGQIFAELWRFAAIVLTLVYIAFGIGSIVRAYENTPRPDSVIIAALELARRRRQAEESGDANGQPRKDASGEQVTATAPVSVHRQQPAGSSLSQQRPQASSTTSSPRIRYRTVSTPVSVGPPSQEAPLSRTPQEIRDARDRHQAEHLRRVIANLQRARQSNARELAGPSSTVQVTN